MRCVYGVNILIYRVSTVYVPYINRISTVVDRELVEEGHAPSVPLRGKMVMGRRKRL